MHVLAAEGGPIQAVFGSFENVWLWVILGVSLLALAFAYYLVREVLAAPEGTKRMREIALAIQEGAKAYLSRQFRTLGIFLALLTVVLFFVLPVPENAAHSDLVIRFGGPLTSKSATLKLSKPALLNTSASFTRSESRVRASSPDGATNSPSRV